MKSVLYQQINQSVVYPLYTASKVAREPN